MMNIVALMMVSFFEKHKSPLNKIENRYTREASKEEAELNDKTIDFCIIFFISSFVYLNRKD